MGSPWLVDGDPVLDSVTKACEAELGVLDKVVHDLGVEPTILLNLRAGQGRAGKWEREGRGEKGLKGARRETMDVVPNTSQQDSQTGQTHDWLQRNYVIMT